MSSRHHIVDFMRGRIIGKIEEGRKITDVAREFDIAHSVVSRLWKSFKTTGMCSRRHRGGRVRSTMPAEDRYIVLSAKRNRRTTAQQHRTARLQWCREHHNWTEQDWACILFSDESRFSPSSDCRRQLIWRESGTAYRPENNQEKDRYPTCSIMVWAGIMINGRNRLHVVENGTMTGQRYIDEVLLPHVRLFRGAVAKVEDKQFETNIENMIKSIKTLSLPVPTRSENFNLFFQSLERAFLTKKINDEYKSEILINLLGERAHNVLLYIKEEELNDYEKLKSIVLREFQLTPRECLNSFKNAVKSSGETYIQFAARSTANFQYYCSLRKVNSFESLCDLIISDKLFETLNKETATHIGIREAEDWFRPIDLAKECDIYISSRSGSHKEIPITYGYTQDPFKNRSQNFKPKIKENYPQYLERENKNCFICGDSSHCARDCEKRFEPKESNDHIHNKINVNTLKIESEKQNSDECANLQYVNIFVENQPVTALIDSGCQIPVLNSSLIRVQTPSEEIITLSSCFGEKRMVEVKPINISLDQHSPGISVRTAISPTLTEEFIIHPSVYSEIEKLGHAKSDVLLNESESSLGAHAYAYPNVVSFQMFLFQSLSVPSFLYVSDSPLVSMEVPLRTAYGQNGRCSMQPKPSSLRAQAQ
ncbi:retrovirus-related Pol polyprotein from transposon opus [Trichonephila clavipes]|nr:retrovirus-related Pol polyprotein from transposon opus [Trichonephila clavipes]